MNDLINEKNEMDTEMDFIDKVKLKSAKAKKRIKRHPKLSLVIITAIVTAIAVIGITTYLHSASLDAEQAKVEGISLANNSEEIDITEIKTDINRELKEQGKLITATVDSTLHVDCEDGEIPLLTQKGLSMQVDYTIDAYVDLTKCEVTNEGNKIIVTLPAVELSKVCLDTDSCKYYDKTNSLFNRIDEEDTRELQSQAAAVALDDNKEELLEEGGEQAVKVIENFLNQISSNTQSGFSYKVIIG